VRDLPAYEKKARCDRRCVRSHNALHGYQGPVKGPRCRCGPHQLTDSRSCLAIHCLTQGRQTRCLHRADGHEHRGCKKIVDLVKQTGRKYMMMETVVYAREFLYIKELYEKGQLGKIQFLQASHQQDMDGWPNYWPGLTPMWYATHCVGPMLALTRATAEYVSCFGSGTIRKELIECYGSP